MPLISDKNNWYFTQRRIVLLRMGNVSDESYREGKNRLIMFNTTPPPPENRVVYEINVGKIWYSQTGNV
jgi:hypothetical protein